MTESMMEKLCFAAFSAGLHPVDIARAQKIWREGLWPEDIARAKKVARAVLQALREPDEGMVEAGRAIIQETRPHDKTGEVIAWHAFTAMIDRILNESGQPKGEVNERA